MTDVTKRSATEEAAFPHYDNWTLYNQLALVLSCFGWRPSIWSLDACPAFGRGDNEQIFVDYLCAKDRINGDDVPMLTAIINGMSVDAESPEMFLRQLYYSPIGNINQAKSFIRALHDRDHVFHFDEDVHKVIWGQPMNPHDLWAIDQRRSELYSTDLGWGSFGCPIGFVLAETKVRDQMKAAQQAMGAHMMRV